MKRTEVYRKKKYKMKKRFLINIFLLLIFVSAVFVYVNRSFIFSKSPVKKSLPSNDKKIVENTETKNTETENADKAEKNSIKEKKLPITVLDNIKATPISECEPSKLNFVSDIINNGINVKDFNRDIDINFGDESDYSDIPGVTSFRGNNYRNSPSYGYADIKEEKLEQVWFSKTGYIDIWTGVGWNGQPSIIKWDMNVQKIMNIFPAKKGKENLKEVIYATLDGKIYFLDLDDGKPTRNPINIGYPHKGSVAVDPRGYPLLYAGQGIPEKNGKPGPIGYRIFSLIDQKTLYFINGYDPDAFRRWGAFDSVGLIDKKTDTLIECGENGILYTVKLNTDFNIENRTISIKPDVTKYRYRSPFGSKIGTENSPTVFRNYIFFADNSGLFQCVDLNTLKPVWIQNITDDTDSTSIIDVTQDSEIALYTACEVDKQGKNGYSYIRKINALTGEIIWEKAIKCTYDSHTNGGALASPVAGKNDITDLVVFNIAKTGKNGNGSTLVALNKKSGQEVWTVNMDYYCWSSPVDIYTKEGKSYLIVCDSGGFMHLLEGVSGRSLDKIPLEANVEASPAVYDNMIVVGTRGQKIWGIKIK